METNLLDDLTARGAKEAMRASIEWFRKNRPGRPIDTDRLTAELKARSQKAWDEAFADLKAAVECGMDQVGTVTFLATFTLMGIEAAKDAAGETAVTL